MNAKTVAQLAIRKLQDESINDPIEIDELPRSIRGLVEDAARRHSSHADFEKAKNKLARAGWVLDLHVGGGASHILTSVDGTVSRYINDQSPIDLEDSELETLFNAAPVAMHELEKSIADLVQVASDGGRGVLSRARADTLLKQIGWKLIAVRHPSASHVLAPRRGNNARHRLLRLVASSQSPIAATLTKSI